MGRHVVWVVAVALLLNMAPAGKLAASRAPAEQREHLSLRGHEQSLHVYGVKGGPPVVLTSGDGGWIHLAVHVAEALAARGFFVVGLDGRAYLESFTAAGHTLRAEDVPGDYATLAEVAAAGASVRPILVGVSEGAGLSVLAASQPSLQQHLAGVVALGLPRLTELAWRWRDSVIYITHGVPNEPTFDTASFLGQVSPLPLAAIHSSNDEFASVPDVEKMMTSAKTPSRLWIVKAGDHGFTDNLAEFDARLLDAIGWVNANAAR